MTTPIDGRGDMPECLCRQIRADIKDSLIPADDPSHPSRRRCPTHDGSGPAVTGSNRTFEDAQGNALTIGIYDIGVGKAVVFDGGAFINAGDAREYAAYLTALVEYMEALDD